MSLQLGIVGLPNVGKSTLFNALTANAVPAENYPFCTVDPNVGVVPVPDDRLVRLSEWVDSRETTPATVEFVDVAGLVREAHKGEGLGNQFLAQIRNVDAVCHVLRLFEDSRVSHVEGTVDPLRDMDVIRTEFALADLEVLEDPLEKLRKRTRLADEDAEEKLSFFESIQERLRRGDDPLTESPDERQRRWLKDVPLLSAKPVLYVLNVDESMLENPDDHPPYRRAADHIEAETEARCVALCAELEAEIIQLDADEQSLYLDEMGLEEPGLDRLVREAYRLLDLVTFFTFNEAELRAWSLPRGSTALEAAGRVHTDFREHFIRADVVPFETFRKHQSWADAKDAGDVRSRGEDYVVQDGDILLFHAGG